MLWFTFIFIIVGFLFPIIDYFWDKRIKKDLENHNKFKTYSLVMLYQWSLVGVIFLSYKIMGIPFRELGFTKTFYDISSFFYFLLGVLTSTIIMIIVFLVIPQGRKKIINQFEAIELLLPVGVKERLLFACLAITAGFCEEVIYRGFMFYYLDQLDWGLSHMAFAIITSILFGLAHVYQGWKNMIITGLLGFALARLYMSQGSIWIPIIIHILFDIKFAIMPNIKKIFEDKSDVSA